MPDDSTPPRAAPVHRIRLHGPWVCPTLDQQRSTVPLRLDALATPDRLRPHTHLTLQRRFGRPTGLAGDTKVYLHVIAGDVPGQLRVNGQSLGTVAANAELRLDISALLQPRNELCVEFPLPRELTLAPSSSNNPWLLRAVSLEIEDGG